MKKSISRSQVKLAKMYKYPGDGSLHSVTVPRTNLHSPYSSVSTLEYSESLGSTQYRLQLASKNNSCNSDMLSASQPCSLNIQELERQFDLTDECPNNTACTNSTLFNVKKRNLSKSIKVLDELGFNNFDTQVCRVNPKPKKSNVSVTDLWGFQMQKQFVRERKYNDALKVLQRKNEYENMRSLRSISKPDKPHVMDENVMRKMLFHERKKELKPSASLNVFKFKTPLSPKNEKVSKDTGILDKIMSKCDELCFQSRELKEFSSGLLRKNDSSYTRLKHIIEPKPIHEKLKKLSKADLIRISQLVRNL